jgi:hypothetical protein
MTVLPARRLHPQPPAVDERGEFGKLVPIGHHGNIFHRRTRRVD